jgi:Tol biopolymer transport system component
VIRRLVGLVLVVCALLALLADAALCEAPAGPRLAFLSSRVRRSEVLSVDPSGGESLTIAGGSEAVRPLPLPFSAIGWSPDGSLLAFSGFSGSQKEPRFDLYVVGADGSGLRRIPGTRNALYPLFSPDGHGLVFTRIARSNRSARETARRPRVRFSSWLANLDTGAVTRLPAKASDVASSFSPDGSTLAVSRAGKGPVADAVAIDLTTGRSSVLARNAAGPVYSPDGSRIAFLRGPERTFHDRHGSTTEVLTDIYTMNVDGSAVTRVTRTPQQIEIDPAWDPSGQRLAYAQLQSGGDEGDFLGFGDSLMEINPDGSCPTRVASDPKTILLSPNWQPGPGREAGPISC